MAGKQIRILEKTTYDQFGAGVNANLTSGIYVATNVDVSGFLYATLVLRGHAWPTGSAGQKVYLQAFASAPTSEDPVTTFRIGSGKPTLDQSGTPIAFSSFSPQIQIAAVNLVNTTNPAAGFLDFILQFTQASTVQPATFTISADLILRS